MTEQMVVEQVPIAKIKPAPDNPRQNVGDVAELAQSIGQVGVLEPLLATRRNGHYELVAGERRLAAATLAGLATVPIIVREFTPEERLLAMTVENLQREDLSPVEEGGAYQALLDALQITQHDLAPRVGKTQSHISKRVALLALPKDVQEKVDSGGIDIAAAAVLAKLATVAGPKAVSTLVRSRPGLHTDYGYIAKRELDRIEAETAFRKVKDELKLSGVKLLSPKKDRYGSLELPKGAVAIGKDGGYYELKLDPEKHKDEPCHAAVVFDSKQTVTFVCTDRKRHPKLKTREESYRTTGSSSKSPQKRAEEKQVREAAASRRAFVAELLERKNAFTKGDTVKLIAEAFIERSTHEATKQAAALLGLDPVETKRRGAQRVEKDYEKPLRDLAAKGESEMLQVALALAFGQLEAGLNTTWHSNWTDEAPYFDLLEEHGHQVAAIENKRAGRRQAKAAA